MNEKLLIPKLPLEPKSKITIILIFVFLFITPFLPWTAFTTGMGQVTAINPNERTQTLTTPVTGFISQWEVGEGARVKRGDVIARLEFADSSLVERYERELDAAQSAVKSAKIMLETSRINLDRQKKLFEQGLSARKEFENAKIDTSKVEMDYSKALATLTKAESQLSRQLQTVIAPRDGIITRILPGERGQLMKAGTPVAVLTPYISTPAVEIWIDGNDASILEEGQKAVLQFEGWPTLQIPGWPGIAIGTFPAKVKLVDPASSYMGKFRVLMVPDGKWPDSPFLRPGSHVKGYILLADSFILKEAWRQLTGFPAVIDPVKDELQRLLEIKK